MKKETTNPEVTTNVQISDKEGQNTVEQIQAEVEKKNLNACTTEEKKLYKKLVGNIDKALAGIDKQFISIACAIWEINQKSLFRAGMYKNIYDCVADLYQIKKSATYSYIAIVDRFCEMDENNHPVGLSERWKEFSVSKLSAILPAPEEILDDFTPDMTVKQIKELVNRAKELTILDAESEEPEDNSQMELDMNVPEEPDNIYDDIDISPDENFTMIGQFEDIDGLDKMRDILSETLATFKSDKKFTGKRFHYEINLVWE